MAHRLPSGVGGRVRRGAGPRRRRRRHLRLGRRVDLGGNDPICRCGSGNAAAAGGGGRWPRNAAPRSRGDASRGRRVPSASRRTGRAGRARPPQLRSEKHSQPRPDGAQICDMKTEFSLKQLANPDIAEADKILRACVHCGFCTATCPTYVLLGDELDSPRGRIYLIKQMLEKNETPTAEVVKHIDRCLSCLACMTTCPSGVNYMHLVDLARVRIERDYARPMVERVLRAVLARVLPRPDLFRWSMMLARLARPLATLLPSPAPGAVSPTL